MYIRVIAVAVQVGGAKDCRSCNAKETGLPVVARWCAATYQVKLLFDSHGQYDLEKTTTLLPSISFSTKSTEFIDLSRRYREESWQMSRPQAHIAPRPRGGTNFLKPALHCMYLCRLVKVGGACRGRQLKYSLVKLFVWKYAVLRPLRYSWFVVRRKGWEIFSTKASEITHYCLASL